MPYKLHMLICNDSDCSATGAQQVYDCLKQIVKDHNLEKVVKVSKSTCLDDCETGPNLLVHPKGTIYNNVKTQDLKTILEAHLKGKVASHLQHHKMLK